MKTFLSVRAGLVFVGVAFAQQFPVMNMVADKVIQKYQSASCEDLWKKKGAPKTEKEQEVIQLLRDDPQMRQAFVD